MSLPHNKPHSPLSSQDVLQELQSGLTQMPLEPLLCPGTHARESLCVPFKNGVSVSPSPVELLRTSPTGLQCQMPRDSFFLCQILLPRESLRDKQIFRRCNFDVPIIAHRQVNRAPRRFDELAVIRIPLSLSLGKRQRAPVQRQAENLRRL